MQLQQNTRLNKSASRSRFTLDVQYVVGGDWPSAVKRKPHLYTKTLTNDTDNVRL